MKTELPLEKLLQHMVDALYLCIVIDKYDTIRYVSHSYAEILGFAVEEIVGKPIQKIIPDSKLPSVARSGKKILGDIFIMRNGEATVCNRFPIIGENGTLQGAFSTATFQDIGAIKRLNSELEQLRRENKIYKQQIEQLKSTPFSLDSVIGSSPSILKIKDIINRIASSNLTVLITGETGVGKEVFANAIHQLSDRKLSPYIKVNCAAIPKELLESELFGYESGAFSGALKGGKPGKFEQANNGTILLDELGELPLQLQSKLLRVIQEREVERLGGTKPIPLNIRIICNTNQNLFKMVADGSFRQDLFYRINVVELAITPLRERLEDIPVLCDFFIEKINRLHGCHVSGISLQALELLTSYHWPGNVRELEHAIERAAIMSLSDVLEADFFDFIMVSAIKSEIKSTSNALLEQRQIAEYNAIQNALIEANGNKTKAAKSLGISRSLLYEKIKKYNH